jgi:hypothetical protein
MFLPTYLKDFTVQIKGFTAWDTGRTHGVYLRPCSISFPRGIQEVSRNKQQGLLVCRWNLQGFPHQFFNQVVPFISRIHCKTSPKTHNNKCCYSPPPAHAFSIPIQVCTRTWSRPEIPFCGMVSPQRSYSITRGSTQPLASRRLGSLWSRTGGKSSTLSPCERDT